MIPIKEHNDIVGKLIKELESKENELKNVEKEKSKSYSQQPQLQPTQNQQTLNKKINQLNKEHKQRVTNLTQQLRNKSLQNKELKERLTTKHNIQAKQKQHIAEILKKTYDRKPSSGADYKISALITHYQAEIEKKSKYIQNLQKQLREAEMSMSKQRQVESPQKNQNYKLVNQDSTGISLTEHQKQLNQVRIQTTKYRKLFEERDKEYKDLTRRYSQLTNQYYKIVNSYGIQEPKFTTKSLKNIKSETNIQKITKKVDKQLKSNALENLLTQMVYSQSETEETRFCKNDFAAKVAKINQNKHHNAHIRQQQTSQDISDHSIEEPALSRKDNQNLASLKIQEIMQYLKVQDVKDIVPKLIESSNSHQQYSLLNTITRSLQVFFYNIGKGKLTKEELVKALQDLQISYNRNMEAVDILDQVCIEAGAKREKLRQKIILLNQIQNQYFAKLKSIKFAQDLAKGNKVLEFIDFFNLDKEEVSLPQQLIKIQQQLKSISKFIKQVRVILQISNEIIAEQALQMTLRYLEKTSALVSKLQKKKQKRIVE